MAITEPAKVSRQRNPSYDTTLDIEQAPAAVPRADLHDVELGEAFAAEPSWKPTTRRSAVAFLTLLGLVGVVVLGAANVASLQDENTALRADIAELRSEHEAVHEAVHASLAANRDNIDDHAGIVRTHAERISAHTDDISTNAAAIHAESTRASDEEQALRRTVAANANSISTHAEVVNPQLDAAALLRFKASGDPSAWPAEVQGWSAAESASVCDWAGVTCAGSRVTGLDFGHSSSGRGLTAGDTTWLSGDISLLAELPLLEFLEIEGTSVFGSVEALAVTRLLAEDAAALLRFKDSAHTSSGWQQIPDGYFCNAAARSYYGMPGMPHYSTQAEAAAACAASSASCQTHDFSCEGSQYYAVWPPENAWPTTSSCTGTSAEVEVRDSVSGMWNYVPGPACDLDAATDGTADCPDGCHPIEAVVGWTAAESGSVCEWTGVECTGSRVVEIDDVEFFLAGDVAELAGVTRLEKFDLSHRFVFGSIEVRLAQIPPFPFLHGTS